MHVFIIFPYQFIRRLVIQTWSSGAVDVIHQQRDVFLFVRVEYAMIPIALIVYEFVVFPDYHSSEVYFLFIAVFFVPIVTFWFIEDIRIINSIFCKIIKTLFVICSIVGILAMLLFINTHLFSGIYNVKSDNQYDIVTSAEYEGMCWIKDNTPEDALLAVDRYQRVAPINYDYKIMHHNTFFGYSAYGQRNCFIEGSGYTLRASRAGEITAWVKNNNRFYDQLDEGRGKLARKIGIDYVVVSKRLFPTPNLENEDYSLCFRNDDLDIYRITE